MILRTTISWVILLAFGKIPPTDNMDEGFGHNCFVHHLHGSAEGVESLKTEKRFCLRKLSSRYASVSGEHKHQTTVNCNCSPQQSRVLASMDGVFD